MSVPCPLGLVHGVGGAAAAEASYDCERILAVNECIIIFINVARVKFRAL